MSGVFEKLVFPLLDRANGTHIVPLIGQLHESENLSREKQRARQEEKLERLLATSQKSAFYRGFENREGPPSDYELLSGLPVVSKDDLRDAPEGLFPLETNEKVYRYATSGSTGRPMVFYRTATQESWFWALRFRIWNWAGYSPGDRYVTVNLNPRLGWKKKLQDRLFRCAYLTMNADDLDARAVQRALSPRGSEPAHLNGFSSSLYAVARRFESLGLEVPEVDGITATGDALYTPYREAIERVFKQRVFDYYGAGGEGFHVASQCAHSETRYHLHPENAIFEVLGADGPCAPGELGRVVLTQLDNFAMPLVRYEVGDLAVPAPPDATCLCGRTLPMLERVEGRVPDLIVLPDETFLVMHFFVVLMKSLEEHLEHYQVVQETLEDLRVRLVAREGADRALVEATLCREILAATRGQVEITIDWTAEIPLSGRGKRRLVISHVGQEWLAGRS